MDGCQAVDALELHDDSAVDDEVEAIAAVGRKPLVADGKGDLLQEWHAPKCELVRQTSLIRGLEQPGPEHLVNINGAGNHHADGRVGRVAHALRSAQTVLSLPTTQLGDSDF